MPLSLHFETANNDLKSAAKTQRIGILFREFSGSCDLTRRGKYWIVSGAKIPAVIIERQRCAFGLDLKACCYADWKECFLSPNNVVVVRIKCNTGQHREAWIPRSIIQKVVFPLPHRES
jgi:hypothetical protein